MLRNSFDFGRFPSIKLFNGSGKETFPLEQDNPDASVSNFRAPQNVHFDDILPMSICGKLGKSNLGFVYGTRGEVSCNQEEV
ncbi:hypothetical protein AVEN_50552-1 [Araneus ventricosus]|uniref:Uncharacterized protein n=1 Tax=Araneus ventricosus TaxID=182803 RepID=A0A4Y2ART4_ARAVE|nr:hypothetical protein AVEN_50552-1 [Araneus ventricosus]